MMAIIKLELTEDILILMLILIEIIKLELEKNIIILMLILI